MAKWVFDGFVEIDGFRNTGSVLSYLDFHKAFDTPTLRRSCVFDTKSGPSTSVVQIGQQHGCSVFCLDVSGMTFKQVA